MLAFPPLDGFVEFSVGASPTSTPRVAPVVGLGNTVVFPGCPARVLVTGEANAQALAAVGNERFPFVALVAKRAPYSEPLVTEADVYDVGVVARPRFVRQDADDGFSTLFEAGPRCRVRKARRLAEGPLVAELEDLADPVVSFDGWGDETRAVLFAAAAAALMDEFESATWAATFLEACRDAAVVAGIASAHLELSVGEAMRLLAAPADQRVKDILWLLARKKP